MHTLVTYRQLTVYHTAGVHREVHNQFIAAHKRKPSWSTKAYVRTDCAIEHHGVVSSGIFGDEIPDKHPREWTKQDLINLQEPMKAYMIEVIATSHCLKQKLISCWY